MSITAKHGRSQSRSLELHCGLNGECQGPKHMSHHLSLSGCTGRELEGRHSRGVQSTPPCGVLTPQVQSSPLHRNTNPSPDEVFRPTHPQMAIWTLGKSVCVGPYGFGTFHMVREAVGRAATSSLCLMFVVLSYLFFPFQEKFGHSDLKVS